MDHLDGTQAIRQERDVVMQFIGYGRCDFAVNSGYNGSQSSLFVGSSHSRDL